MKPLIYLAGPIDGGGTRAANLALALDYAEYILEIGGIPYSPQLNGIFWNAFSPKPRDVWLQMDFDMILHCDALVRMPGESEGADKEFEFALSHGIVCFVGKLPSVGIDSWWVKNFLKDHYESHTKP